WSLTLSWLDVVRSTAQIGFVHEYVAYKTSLRWVTSTLLGGWGLSLLRHPIGWPDALNGCGLALWFSGLPARGLSRMEGCVPTEA
ncbi:hypothetical protein MK280_19965, partial [Myxococcota bacterium]|nr:hypothetical protein [Myxococcota bacterium]